MRRTDETSASHPRTVASSDGAGAESVAPPSKTRRKADMHALQDLGEALALLSPARLAQLAIPEQLADAVTQVRGITKWEARRRQMQFIGRLMRDVDPAPIRARIAGWSHTTNAQKAHQHDVEAWRTRLMAEPQALDRLCEHAPEADRPGLEALLSRAREEHSRGGPPHAFRQLFRLLNTVLAAPAGSDAPARDAPDRAP